MTEPLFLENLNKLELKTFIIGYKNEGESILFLLLYDDIPIYSGVVDSYETETINCSIELLEQYKIKNLDFFCWTHPHEDHSKGIIDILKGFASNKTSIILPEMVYGNENDIISYNPEEKKILEEINSYLKGRNYNVNSVGVADYQFNRIYNRKLKGSLNGEINFCIKALSPNSSLLRRKMISGGIKKNQLSIALIIELGEFKVFLGGDAEDQNINLFDKDLLEDINIIKIPHHSSKTSKFLPILLTAISKNKNSTIACTTVSRTHKLPNMDIIEEYKTCSKTILSTGSCDSKDDTENYGIIEITFSPHDNKIKYRKTKNVSVLY